MSKKNAAGCKKKKEIKANVKVKMEAIVEVVQNSIHKYAVHRNTPMWKSIQDALIKGTQDDRNARSKEKFDVVKNINRQANRIQRQSGTR